MQAGFFAELAIGVAMMLVVEGLIYAGFPGAIRRLTEQAIKLPDNTLRSFGIVAMAIGILLIWLIRR